MKNKIFYYIVSIGIFFFITIALLKTSFKIYTITTSLIIVVLVIDLISYLINNKDEKSIYNNTLKNIIKTYYPVLSQVTEIPDLDKKEIIQLYSFNDLLNVQTKNDKTIYYLKNENETSFFIIDGDTVCIYWLKLDEYMPAQKIGSKKIDEEELSLIDKTTILKLKNGKLIKVSPIYRKKEKNEK